MKEIMIATPCYGGMASVPYFESVLNASSRPDAPYVATLSTITNESLITRARNNLANQVLDSNFDRLVFIDADIRFSPEDLDRIVMTDKDVIGGLVPVKTIDFEKAASQPDGEKAREAALKYAYTPHMVSKTESSRRESVRGPASGSVAETKAPASTLQQVRHLGAAFLSISREALEIVAAANPQLSYRKEGKVHYALFDTMVKDGNYLSEDYAFCERWIETGGTVWADMECRVSHFGNYEFTC